jgi:hypothetical protein
MEDKIKQISMNSKKRTIGNILPLPIIEMIRDRSLLLGGLCPPTPLGFNALLPKQRVELQIDKKGRAGFCARPTSASAPESALGSRPRVALSSAQVNMDYNTIGPLLVNRKITQTKTSAIALCSLAKIPIWKEVKKLSFQPFNPTLGAPLFSKQKQLSK